MSLLSQRDQTRMKATFLPKRENPLPDHIKTQADLGRAMLEQAKADRKARSEISAPRLPNFKSHGGAKIEDRDKLTERRELVFLCVEANGPVTVGQVADITGLCIDLVRNDMHDLRLRYLLDKSEEKVGSSHLWSVKEGAVK